MVATRKKPTRPARTKDLSYIAKQLRPLAMKITDFNFDPANVRKHSARNLEATRASLARYGQRKPIVVNRHGLIVEAGNGTLVAAKSLKWEWIAAVIVEDDATTAAGYSIADNRTAELASWDTDALQKLLNTLEVDIPAIDLGFSEVELKSLLGNQVTIPGPLGTQGPPGDDPGASEAPDDPVSEAGKIYQLGPHRLMCGDSTVADNVASLLGDAEPRLMVTDPPYGVEYDPNWRNEAAEKGLIAHSASRVGVVENDGRADWSEAWALSPSLVAYVWHSFLFGNIVRASLENLNFIPRSQIIWAKPRFAISRGHYHWQHEACIYVVRKGKTSEWIGDCSQTTLWTIQLDENVEGGHSTQKPLECMERPIRHHKGDVYDPFLGSGTTLIATARQGRVCYGMELSESYCDVIRKRWGAYARGIGADPGSDAL